MKNWRDYVGINPDDGLQTFYMEVIDTENGPGFRIQKVKFEIEDLTDTEETIGKLVDEAILSFQKIKIENEIALEKEKNKVALVTKRGRANKNFNNIWYYKGTNWFDCPLTVVEYKGKFKLFKHPSFEDYGFVAE